MDLIQNYTSDAHSQVQGKIAYMGASARNQPAGARDAFFAQNTLCSTRS